MLQLRTLPNAPLPFKKRKSQESWVRNATSPFLEAKWVTFCFGFFSPGSGGTGAQRLTSSNPRPRSPGITRDFAFSGPQTWRTFLNNHVQNLVSVDFFTIPTIRFQVLYVFLVLAHDRRRVVHFNVTVHPTAEWTAQQLREAFPFDQIPRYLLRDRDKIFGDTFPEQVKDMNIEEVLSAPRSPWQRAYVERVIGSIRRECLDHVIVFGEASLRPFVGDGRTGASADPGTRARTSARNAPSWRTAPPLRTTRCLNASEPGQLAIRSLAESTGVHSRCRFAPAIGASPGLDS